MGYYKHTYQADKWLQIKQFNASYCFTIYLGCSFKEYIVAIILCKLEILQHKEISCDFREQANSSFPVWLFQTMKQKYDANLYLSHLLHCIFFKRLPHSAVKANIVWGLSRLRLPKCYYESLIIVIVSCTTVVHWSLDLYLTGHHIPNIPAS